jgi:large subunit ribosomal protein L21
MQKCRLETNFGTFRIREFFAMYAVIEQGSKQYKVAEGDSLNIELTEVPPDAKTIELDKVLLVGEGQDVKIGTPYLEGAKVIASFKTTAEDALVKGKKLYPAYFRRRKNSRRRTGHRQKYLEVVIDKIQA